MIPIGLILLTFSPLFLGFGSFIADFNETFVIPNAPNIDAWYLTLFNYLPQGLLVRTITTSVLSTALLSRIIEERMKSLVQLFCLLTTLETNIIL